MVSNYGSWKKHPRSFDAGKYANAEMCELVHNHRLLEPVGNILPAEAEADYYVTLDEPRMAA